MTGSRTRNTLIGSTTVVAVGLLLAACGGGQASTADPSASGSMAPSASASGQHFDSLEAVFTAVDDELGCPAEVSGDHSFMIDGEPTGLPGRQCGNNLLIGWSDDPTKAEAALGIVADADGEVSAVQGPGWFVADVSEVAERADMSGPDSESNDLKALAEQLGASYGAL
ncbi:hypothetical protein AB0333_10795 [Citricoccus sp. NPDC079358]|uniref:hypothetical protein n=1 Tax=Citricoccus sp. NPDC079358 TaxID=3154653 RepID=UPI0034502B0B